MLQIELLDTQNKSQLNKFVSFPYRLYSGHPQWVPPIWIDVNTQLNRQKHPFYEHSEADYYMAVRDGKVVGRIAALVNKNYNRCHGSRQGQFYLFECENDPEAAGELFNRVFEWCRERKLDRIVGPKGYGPLDGYGIQFEGYEHRQMMMMMNYNYPYYNDLVTALGFVKEVDFLSCYLNPDEFRLPERVHRIAERVKQRGTLQVQRFKTRRDLRNWAAKIGKAYNNAFVNNWEYVPLTDNEISFVLENILSFADPRLIKVITHEDDAVGFLFGFPDVSAALQRHNGRLFPFGILDLLLEVRRTDWVALNGAGILPEFQGRGGNALMYTEMVNTIRDYNFKHADLTQVAETAVQMRSDLINLGGKPYKNHRVYSRQL